MPTGGDTRALALLAGVLLAAVVCYAPALDGELLFDDKAEIEQNAAVRELAGYDLGGRLAAGGRILPELTFALDYARSGLAPRTYHVTSLAVHLVAIVLAFALGRRLLAAVGWPEPSGPALAAAALWGLHPLNSQAVNYVVQRSEVMASLFYLLAVWLVLVAAERGPTLAGGVAYLGALAAALAGFYSKQIVVTVPAAVVLALVLAGRPRPAAGHPWLRRLGLAAPFGVLAVWAGTRALRGMAGSGDAGFQIPGLTPASYLASELRVLVQYLRLLVWPAGLNLDHGLTPSRSPLDPAVLASAAALAALCAGVGALAWWGARPERDPPLARATRLAAFGAAWFVVVVSPTSSVVPLVDLMFEHRVYLASWGLVLGAVGLAAAALARLGPRRAAPAGLLLTLLPCVALGLATSRRSAVWADPARVWADSVEEAPGNWRAHQNLAQVLASRGELRRAVALRERALALAERPEDRGDVLRNLGANLVELDEVPRAVAVLADAERLLPRDAGVQNNLALCAEALGGFDEAERRARRAIALAPGRPNAYGTLGRLLARRGDLPGALGAFQAAAARGPDELVPLYNLARAQEWAGATADACATWQRYAEIRAGAGAREARAARARLGCAP